MKEISATELKDHIRKKIVVEDLESSKREEAVVKKLRGRLMFYSPERNANFEIINFGQYKFYTTT